MICARSWVKNVSPGLAEERLGVRQGIFKNCSLAFDFLF